MRVSMCLVAVPLCLSFAACTADSSDPVDSSPASPPPPATAATPEPVAPPPASAPPPVGDPPALDEGAIFTIDNAAEANAVYAFAREEDGSLVAAGVHPTGGRGTGAGLGSQGALALSADHHVLVVVDAGSDQITSFAVDGASLDFRSRISSGGVMPVSVAIYGSFVYALNAGGSGNVSGFTLDADGRLAPLAGSTRALGSPAAGAAQISFSPAGDALVVTEKATSTLDTFVVGPDGSASPATSNASAGATPFGFAFTPDGAVVVSEAFGGAAGAGAVSSYALDPPAIAGQGAARELHAVSSSVPDHQAAPCWVAVRADGRVAYTTNAASGNLSGYSVAPDGSLTLLGDGVSVSTGDGSKPLDLTFDRASKRLYVLAGGSHDIRTLDAADDGALALRAAPAPHVPDTATGLVGW
jgi:6-phosphogluconolactonase (cycloisomerase 2 family)